METQRIVLERSPDTTIGYLIPLNRAASGPTPVRDHLTVGRDSSCQIVIEDPFVSSRHARIEKKTVGFVIRDLHSRNGTHLNGSRVTEAALTVGDRLGFGESVFVFAEAPSESARLHSKNSAWNEQLLRLPSFAAADFPVLLIGPSGSGKEILARAIHDLSARAKGQFVSINCSALGENLIESELFGHVRGSFTGATHDRKGAFETARGGTLFLDEVGDLPLSLQPKLLRALENNEIRPVGSDRTIETNIRIIAATHKNLATEVRLGGFREDLYYRLNVCQLRPPILTERMEDFEDLVYHFARQFRVRLSFNTILKLKQHAWPGNIRELRNLLARASVYYPGKHIQPEDITAILESQPIAAAGTLDDGSSAVSGTSGSLIREIERDMIVRRLIANRGNQRRTAMDLGLPKSTLHDRIRAYSIDLKQIQSAVELVEE